jgi:hypothetical protein
MAKTVSVVTAVTLLIATFAAPGFAIDREISLSSTQQEVSATDTLISANRKGSKRFGGSNSKGKGSRYVGGYKK